MNPQEVKIKEVKIRNKFIFVALTLSILVVLFVAFLFYRDLHIMHSMVYNEYKRVYIENSNNEVRSVVNYFVNSMEFEQNRLLDESRSQLKNRVLEACRMLNFFYDSLAGRLPLNDVESILLKALTIEDRSFTVVDEKGNVLLSSYFRVGSNVANYRDARDNRLFEIVKRDIENSKYREAFVTFYARRNEFYMEKPSGGVHTMVLYVKYLPRFGWYVGDVISYDTIERKLQERFKDQISRFRYGVNGEGYLFILKLIIKKGRIKVIRVANPNKSQGSIGKEVPLDITDVTGKRFLREMIKIALTKGSGFVRYRFRIPGTDRVSEKTTFIRYYSKWGWIIGSGYYPEIFYEDLKMQDEKLNSMLKRLIFTFAAKLFVFNVILFLGLLYFVNKIMGSITLYRERLESREKFQLHLIESIPNPIFIIDRDGHFINVNRAFERFFCIDEDELKKGYSDKAIESLCKEALRFLGKKKKGIAELRVRVCGNKDKFLELHVSNFYDKSGDVAGVIGILFDITLQKRVEDELTEMSLKDELTGLFNRRCFNQVLPREMERAARYNQKLSLVLYDIDHFKKVNDTYGHQVGDVVLKELSNLIKNSLRNVDYLFRIGGEEFAIILTDTDLEGALAAAEKLRKRVEEYSFPHVGKVTISLGVATMKPQDTPKTLLKRADDALYRAKRKGRNRVEFL